MFSENCVPMEGTLNQNEVVSALGRAKLVIGMKAAELLKWNPIRFSTNGS